MVAPLGKKERRVVYDKRKFFFYIKHYKTIVYICYAFFPKTVGKDRERCLRNTCFLPFVRTFNHHYSMTKNVIADLPPVTFSPCKIVPS